MNASLPTELARRVGRREVLLGGLAAGTSALATARAPAVPAAPIVPGPIEPLVPQRAAAWQAAPATDIVLPAPDALRDRLYDELVTRIYTAPGEPAVMLLLAYRAVQDGVVQLHRPEVCYPASGFALDQGETFGLALAGRAVPCRAYAASRGGRSEHLLYFTRIGGAFPLSWAEQRWAVLAANLRGRIPDGLLLRISTITPDRGLAMASLTRFLPALAAAGSPGFRQLLTGAPA